MGIEGRTDGDLFVARAFCVYHHVGFEIPVRLGLFTLFSSSTVTFTREEGRAVWGQVNRREGRRRSRGRREERRRERGDWLHAAAGLGGK